MRTVIIAAGLCLAASLGHAQDSARIKDATATIDGRRIQNADAEPGNWLSHGRTYTEQRYSPLDKINDRNVAQLGLAWSVDLDTNRGVESTPIVADGVIFATGPWSIVWAVDGRTGKLLWTYDPEVPRQWGRRACCDVVNRGVAVWKGKVYVGSLDGRLIALDAATGKKVWEVDTIIERGRPYTITGAPRVAKGKVIIGNGGAEYGVRGYVTAYDAETGKQDWRFFTVPGNPAEPAEDAAMARALPTWHGRWWETGGGGTVWDAIVYDPEFDLVYLGVGNGSPWAQQARSPGGGDNLYLSSIVAVRPDSGEMVWWYQTTPGDTWDYTATQPIMLADLQIEGKTRKVLMQAPKNGFFYVLDRRTGQLISAEKFATVTWAAGIDKHTGRPIEIPSQRYNTGPAVVYPSALGAHSWHPWSYSPKTGLVYIPAMEVPGVFNLKDYKYDKRTWNLGTDTLETFTAFPREVASGSLLAWDPVKQKEAWRVKYDTPWNGGTLATAGNLVFQGIAKGGKFAAYAADTGKKLWEFDAQTGVVAGPVTWSVDGEQYVTVMAGWGGVFTLLGGDAAQAAGVRHVGRMLTFKLDGKQTLKPLAELPTIPVPPPLPGTVTEAMLKQGSVLYHQNCLQCHGPSAVGAGQLRDIRHTDGSMFDSYPQIVLEGAFLARGMPKFDDILSKEDVEKIRYFVQSQAIADHERRSKAPAPKR